MVVVGIEVQDTTDLEVVQAQVEVQGLAVALAGRGLDADDAHSLFGHYHFEGVDQGSSDALTLQIGRHRHPVEVDGGVGHGRAPEAEIAGEPLVFARCRVERHDGPVPHFGAQQAVVYELEGDLNLFPVEVVDLREQFGDRRAIFGADVADEH